MSKNNKVWEEVELDCNFALREGQLILTLLQKAPITAPAAQLRAISDDAESIAAKLKAAAHAARTPAPVDKD
jgi:hypothetical protein